MLYHFKSNYHYLYPLFKRELDVKGQLESLAVRVSGRMKNATCIMQELGYVSTLVKKKILFLSFCFFLNTFLRENKILFLSS